MTRVIIQPSYGNREAWRHWQDTLAEKVPYSTSARSSKLTAEQRANLDRLHPTRSARFWGATGNHDRRMSTLQIGDIVLFTGKKQVRAIGEVAYSFRNAAFADSLWEPHAERGSYHNVYSLFGFVSTAIPYEEIWELPGFNAGDNFMGLRFLDADKSSVIIEGLAIATATSRAARLQQERHLERELHQGAKVIPPEAVNAETVTYVQAATTLTVRRAEALLVKEYRSTLDGMKVNRIQTVAGITDLHIVGSDGVDIVEAKRGANHGLVRQALGQLLDYVCHAPDPVLRLTALFPERPADLDVSLLHRYGIDCVYREAPAKFTRLEAPAPKREHMRHIWEESGHS